MRAAVTLARKHTGKQLILSAGYHGWDPMWTVPDKRFEPNKDGIIHFYFILEQLASMVNQYKDKIAAVAISPDLSYFSTSFYDIFFEICEQNSLFVIIDDVKCGYRYHTGSSIDPERHKADLYVMSKGLANGARISSIVGDSSILSHAKEFTYTSFFDSYSICAALFTLTKAKKHDIYSRINETGNQFITRFIEMAQIYRLPIDIAGNGNLFQFVFATQHLSDAFYESCTEQGILLYAEDNQCPSYSFGEEALHYALDRFDRVLTILSTEQSSVLGQDIPKSRYNIAAFCQTDGCAENMTYDEKMLLVKKMGGTE